SLWEIIAYNAEAEGVTEALAVTGAEIVFMFAVALVVLVAIAAVIWLVNYLVRLCIEGGCAKMAGYVEAGVRWTARAGHVAEVGTFLTAVGTATQPQDDPCDDLVWTGEGWVPYFGPKPHQCEEENDPCERAANHLTLSDAQFYNHILPRHGDPEHARYEGERGYGRNNGVFKGDDNLVRAQIQLVMDSPSDIGPSGYTDAPCQAELWLGYFIGYDINGQESETIRITFDYEGRVNSAFPI
ncbi:MAG TPA: hypothetical protein VH482_21800, partial [Thermomicrobiales bacterium]